MTGLSFPLHGVTEPETKTFELYPTNEFGVYEANIEFDLFSSTLNIEDVEFDVSGHFSLERFVWVELNWESDTGEHKVTLDSFPPSVSYEHKQDNVELFLRISTHSISVRVKILEQHRGFPILTFAYYAPF